MTDLQPSKAPGLSVIIPASNEEAYLGDCLRALLASGPVPGGAEAIIVANGCDDRTASIAREFRDRAVASGWGWRVIELEQGSKIGALNAGDQAASGDLRAYLDADVIVSPPLMARLQQALSQAMGPVYASGRPHIPRPQSKVTRAYAHLWQRLPFARSPAPGYGLFAVNRPGRARWGAFPAIISDDTFVRLQFAPHERIEVDAPYDWPMVEGWSHLVRVRRRQDAGVAEIAARWPELLANEAKPPLRAGELLGLALRAPLGFAVYAAVSLAVRRGRQPQAWTRGR